MRAFRPPQFAWRRLAFVAGRAMAELGRTDACARRDAWHPYFIPGTRVHGTDPTGIQYCSPEVRDRRWVPKWVVFRDRAGSRLRTRTRLIRAIWENTAAQRAIDRQFDRARQLEEKADRLWDDD